VISMSVCVSFLPVMYLNFTRFSRRFAMSVAVSFSGIVTVRYKCTFCFVDDDIMGPMVQAIQLTLNTSV